MWLPGFRRREVRLYPNPAQVLDFLMGGDGYVGEEDGEEESEGEGSEGSEGGGGEEGEAAAAKTARLRLWALPLKE